MAVTNDTHTLKIENAGLRVALRKVKSLETPLALFSQQYEEAREAFVAQRAARMEHALVAAFSGPNVREDTLSTLLSTLDDARFQRVQQNLEFEAAREALPERVAMLANIAAALVILDASVEQLIRLERAVRYLEPLDVARLALVAQKEQVVQAELDESLSRLMAAGCLNVSPTNSERSTGFYIALSDLGRLVNSAAAQSA